MNESEYSNYFSWQQLHGEVAFCHCYLLNLNRLLYRWAFRQCRFCLQKIRTFYVCVHKRSKLSNFNDIYLAQLIHTSLNCHTKWTASVSIFYIDIDSAVKDSLDHSWISFMNEKKVCLNLNLPYSGISVLISNYQRSVHRKSEHKRNWAKQKTQNQLIK